MNIPPRTSSLQAYHMLIYKSAIHPEFFPISGRRRILHGAYEFESWVYQGGHVLRFQNNGACAVEVVGEHIEKLPQRGLVIALPCAGERDHDETIGEKISVMTSVQTETLSDHLYQSTYNELIEHGRMTEGLMSVWGDELDRPNLSLIDIQRYNDQIHAQGYHCRSDCSLVLRTQSIFQLKEDE